MADSAGGEGGRPASLIATLEEGRRQFLELVADVRPDLHRYCARMTGSVTDGEDVVQDTLARAYYQLSELRELPPLRPWLFRIAHNRAIDHLRRNAYRALRASHKYTAMMECRTRKKPSGMTIMPKP